MELKSFAQVCEFFYRAFNELRNVSEITYAFGQRLLGAGCVSEMVT